jgi:cell division protein FtsB
MPADAIAALPSRTQARRPGRLRRTTCAVLIFLCFLFVMDNLVGDRGLVALVRVRRDADRLAEQVARTTAENTKARELVLRLTSDPATIEEIARRELGMIKPGEKLFIIRDVPGPGQPR